MSIRETPASAGQAQLLTTRSALRITPFIALALLAACGRNKSRPPVQPDASVRPGSQAAARDWKAGAPEGYVMVLDDKNGDSLAVSYHKQGERFDVTTGPAHLLYAPADTLSGIYVLATTFTELEKPLHPEAFGLFVGGTDVTGAAARYLYFLVRGSGEFLVKVRDGGDTRDIIPWTANKAVSRSDPTGRATYRLAIQLQRDSLRFLVNSIRVATVPRAGLPTEGVFGIRVNHNLHVRVDAVRRTFR